MRLLAAIITIAQEQAPTTLQTIVVGTDAGGGHGPVVKHARAANKTDTPIAETP